MLNIDQETKTNYKFFKMKYLLLVALPRNYFWFGCLLFFCLEFIACRCW